MWKISDLSQQLLYCEPSQCLLICLHLCKWILASSLFWGWATECFSHGCSGCVLHYQCSLPCISTPYLIRWKVSQYMNTGCAAAMAMVKYIRSWFLAPRTRTPSAAASDRIFNLSVRIYDTHRWFSKTEGSVFEPKMNIVAVIWSHGIWPCLFYENAMVVLVQWTLPVIPNLVSYY